MSILTIGGLIYKLLIKDVLFFDNYLFKFKDYFVLFYNMELCHGKNLFLGLELLGVYTMEIIWDHAMFCSGISIITISDYLAVGIDLSRSVVVGLFTYSVLMTTDILGVNATVVLVSEDQRTYVKLTRVLARKFNSLYGHFLQNRKNLFVAGQGYLHFQERKNGQEQS